MSSNKILTDDACEKLHKWKQQMDLNQFKGNQNQILLHSIHALPLLHLVKSDLLVMLKNQVNLYQGRNQWGRTLIISHESCEFK